MSEPDTITVRRAEDRDIPSLGHLGASLMRIHHGFDQRRFLSPGDNAEAGYAEFLRAQMSNPEMLVLVAEQKDGPGGIVGYLYAGIEPESFKELRARAGYIHDILVADDVRGGGTGARLIDTAVNWLREQGMPRVLLWAAAPNEKARRLFEAHGFKATMVEMTKEL